MNAPVRRRTFFRGANIRVPCSPFHGRTANKDDARLSSREADNPSAKPMVAQRIEGIIMDRDDIRPIDQVAQPTRRGLWAGAAALTPIACCHRCRCSNAEPQRAAAHRRSAKGRKRRAPAGLDSQSNHRCRRPERSRQGAEYMARLARDSGFQTAEIISNRRLARRVGHARCRRAENARRLFHVRREAVQSGRVVSSPPLEARLVDNDLGRVIVGRGAVNQKGPEIAFLGGTACAARRRPPAAGEHRS
jgi:hypothetical protein